MLPDDTVAAFQNPLLERAAREYAGKPEGELTVADLKGLTALYVCGDRYWFAAPQQGVDAAAAGVETAEVVDPSGQSITVQRGGHPRAVRPRVFFRACASSRSNFSR